MGEQTIIFSRLDLIWLLGGVFILGFVFIIWSYYRSPVSGTIKGICFFLRTLGLSAMILFLLNPMWSGKRAKPGLNHLILLADNSESMNIHDRGLSKSRGDIMRELLTNDVGGWQEQVEKTFVLKKYLFDYRLHGTSDYSDLSCSGKVSSLGFSLRQIADQNQGQPAAGIVLFTDGNATDLSFDRFEAKGLPPIYPVVMGKDFTGRDVSIESVVASQSLFEDTPVTIRSKINAPGLSGESIAVRLMDRFGEIIESKTQKAPSGENSLTFEFTHRPLRSGIAFYQLKAGLASEMDLASDIIPTQEATYANNHRFLAVDRGQGPYRILYVSGRPNWEYKFLKRAIDEDPYLQITALIRLANREPKFAFRSRRSGENNPLFTGFDRTDEMTERYDEPVLIRLNTRDEAELRSGFPKSEEELYVFHGIIIDDIEAGFFTSEQHALVRRFVSERGGGLLTLGGVDSYQQGKYGQTIIGDILPIYLDSVQDIAKGQLRFSLTREGWLEQWVRLRSNEAGEKERITEMPSLEVINPVRGIKPGAVILANMTDTAGKTYPALATHRFGNGRVASMMLGDVWRWGFQNAEAHADMDKSWRQTLRWLMANVPNRVDVVVEPEANNSNASVLIKVKVKDAKFQPEDNATVQLKVQRVQEALISTNQVSIMAEESMTEAGSYQASYTPRLSGNFQVDVTVTNSAGAEIGRVRTGWSTDLAGNEYRQLKPNTALLELLAKQTGGELVKPESLDSFVKKLPFRKMPVTESWTYPAWHQPWVFIFVLACFIAEWGLRRWKGLP